MKRTRGRPKKKVSQESFEKVDALVGAGVSVAKASAIAGISKYLYLVEKNRREDRGNERR